MSGKNRWRVLVLLGLALVVGLLVYNLPTARAANRDFALQVSPSPLVNTVKPGKLTEMDISIRNGGSQAEELKIEPRSFTISKNSETVKLGDSAPPEIANWISFSAPTFKVQPGEIYTQKLRLNVPANAGFSYPFALLISRKDEPKVTTGRQIKGSVAIFALINIDRPGAKKELKPVKITTSKHIYEYLPVEVEVQLQNTGNTIVQPFGNVFIQRHANDKSPISTLKVNNTQGYILPETTRTLKVNWANGFQVNKVVHNDDGSTTHSLTWNWGKLNDLRIGRYTAKVVAAYNDGRRDVPIEGEVTFWVFPWRVLLPALIVILLFLFGLWTVVRKFVKFTRPKKPQPKR